MRQDDTGDGGQIKRLQQEPVGTLCISPDTFVGIGCLLVCVLASVLILRVRPTMIRPGRTFAVEDHAVLDYVIGVDRGGLKTAQEAGQRSLETMPYKWSFVDNRFWSNTLCAERKEALPCASLIAMDIERIQAGRGYVRYPFLFISNNEAMIALVRTDRGVFETAISLTGESPTETLALRSRLLTSVEQVAFILVYSSRHGYRILEKSTFVEMLNSVTTDSEETTSPD